MGHDHTDIATDILEVPEPPQGADDPLIHDLLEDIENSLIGDSTPRDQFRGRVRTYVRHLLYIATMEDAEYTLADLREVIADPDEYERFWGLLDDDEIEESVQSFGDLSPRLRKRVCEILDPKSRTTRLM